MRIRLISASILLALATSSCASTFTTGAAIVDGQRITRAQLDDMVEARLQGQQVEGAQRVAIEREALAELISIVLLRRLARDRDVEVDPARLERELADVRSRFATEEEFLQRVEEAGFTLESLRERFHDELLREALAGELAPRVTSAEINERYRAQLDQYRQVKVQHILFLVDQSNTEAAAKRKAEAALRRIRAGESFATLAKQMSQDTSTAPEGGALPGWTSLAGLDQTFARAAFEAPVNRPVGPVRSQFGYHLILTTAKRTRPLSEVREEITRALAGEAGGELLRTALQEVGERARVAVNPRYGDWDPETGTVVPHSSYVPADPQEEPPAQQPLPPGLEPQP